MMTNFIIPIEQLESFQVMAAILDKKQRDYAVTVIISIQQKSITWIGGNAHNFNLMVFPLEKGHGLKNASFAIPGDFLCQALHSVCYRGKEGKKQNVEPLVLTLDYKNGNYVSVTHVERTRILNASNKTFPPLRKFQTLTSVDAHIEYLRANEQRTYHRVSVADIKQSCIFSNTKLPFEYLQLDAEEKRVKIQRQGKVDADKLPDNIKLPVTITFTPEVLDELERLVNGTEAEEVHLSNEGESITITTPEQTVTKSIAGLKEFINREPEKMTYEATLIVDILCLKAEIDAQRSYQEAKKNNECYMLFHCNELLIFNAMTGNSLSRMVYVRFLSSDVTRLYRFHPTDLINVRIADILSMKQVKLVISKNSKGQSYMEFYCGTQESLPYAKIPVESEDGSIEGAIKLKQDYLEKVKDDSH
jgi:hypothetical protein